MLALTSSLAALACGGFFCDTPTVDPYDPVLELPVAQSGEQILFHVEDGTVTAHVLISYEGEADAFAWVLPVPGVPDVFESSERLFQLLGAATAPTVTLDRVNRCEDLQADADTDADADSDTDADADTDVSVPEVVVVSQEVVGPYESVVLSATDAVALVEWLQASGYDVPDSFAGAIQPYVSPGMTFLALKLATDNDSGDIEPIALRWPGEHPSIPLSLTAIAATEDMPVTVYLSGPGRGVSLSSLHVELNPLGYNWFGDGLQLSERLALAADEGGGNAFMTTFADVPLRLSVPSTDGLAQITSALGWFQALPAEVTADPALFPILREFVPAPVGLNVGLRFYNRPENYPRAWARLDDTFDPVAATAAVEEQIVAPLREADDLFANAAWLTRLDTVLSPREMAVDPIFGFNPELPPVSPAVEAVLYTDCAPGDPTSEPVFTLVLPDGTALALPTSEEIGGDASPTLLLEELIVHDAIRVTRYSETGPGEVIADYTDELTSTAGPGVDGERHREGAKGCGCRDVPAGALATPLAALILLAGRRRSAR